ncbi:hypothetical protein D3C75_1188830 [compost metagenome]
MGINIAIGLKIPLRDRIFDDLTERIGGAVSIESILNRFYFLLQRVFDLGDQTLFAVRDPVNDRMDGR